MKLQKGFTIIELLITMTIGSLLIGFITMNLVKTQHTTSVTSAQEALLADLRGQQVKAMNGAATSGGASDSYGIYIETNKYTLFHGASYNQNDPANMSVTMDGPISLTATSNPVVFSQMSGEIGVNTETITLTNTAGGETKQIILNKYGVKTNN